MHDVLDLRDLVTDEAEQLSLSGYPVGADLQGQIQQAVAAGDLDRLADLGRELASLSPKDSWRYDEPDDAGVLGAIAAGVEDLDVDDAGLADRIRGAWLGRTVGNTLGKPVEGLTRRQLETYLRAAGQWPLTGYVPLLDPLPTGVPALHPSAPTSSAGRFVDVPRDDDIDYTILAMHLVESHGRDFTTEHVAAAWLDRLPFTQTYTAERAAYRNLIQGLRPTATATHANPYREWIGALIRADFFGYISPGRPGEAARMALVDARLSHTGNGLYGAMWAAALIAAAFSATSGDQAVQHALGVVPPESRLRDVIERVRDLRREGASQVQALDWVDDELGDYPWVHTLNNAALIAIGLLWGSDFTEAVGITMSGGRDTDSNAATVGSVVGALTGVAGIPEALVGTTHVHVRSAVRDFDRITVEELASRTHKLAQRTRTRGEDAQR